MIGFSLTAQANQESNSSRAMNLVIRNHKQITKISDFITLNYPSDKYILVSVGRSLTAIDIYLRLAGIQVQNLPMTNAGSDFDDINRSKYFRQHIIRQVSNPLRKKILFLDFSFLGTTFQYLQQELLAHNDLEMISSGFEFLAVTTRWQHRTLLAKKFSETLRVPYNFYLLNTLFSNFTHDLIRSNFEDFSEFKSYQITLARGTPPVPNPNNQFLIDAAIDHLHIKSKRSTVPSCTFFLNGE